jgi:hypothetical protein
LLHPVSQFGPTMQALRSMDPEVRSLIMKHAPAIGLLMAGALVMIFSRELLIQLKTGTTQFRFSAQDCRAGKPIQYWLSVFLWIFYLFIALCFFAAMLVNLPIVKDPILS